MVSPTVVTCEYGFFGVGVLQVGERQCRVAEVCLVEIGRTEIGVCQVGIGQDGLLEPCAPQVGIRQVGVGQVRVFEDRIPEVSLGEVEAFEGIAFFHHLFKDGSKRLTGDQIDDVSRLVCEFECLVRQQGVIPGIVKDDGIVSSERPLVLMTSMVRPRFSMSVWSLARSSIVSTRLGMVFLLRKRPLAKSCPLPVCRILTADSLCRMRAMAMASSP